MPVSMGLDGWKGPPGVDFCALWPQIDGFLSSNGWTADPGSLDCCEASPRRHAALHHGCDAALAKRALHEPSQRSPPRGGRAKARVSPLLARQNGLGEPSVVLRGA